MDQHEILSQEMSGERMGRMEKQENGVGVKKICEPVTLKEELLRRKKKKKEENSRKEGIYICKIGQICG